LTAAGYAWVVLLCPLAGMVVIALGWKVLRGNSAGWLGSLSILLSFVASLLCLRQMLALPEEERIISSSAFTYIRTAGVDVDLGILVDPLSVFMSLVV
jgi:NADH-quinone oxidoreductase subunit L